MSDKENLLRCLLSVARRAGRIAKVCREDGHLLSLLVQEKKESEKNPRFLHDFKTLADVLVQEVIKYHLCIKFPQLEGNVYGEESNEFSNGEVSVKVEVQKNENDTATLLNQVLNDEEAAATLSRVIHEDDDYVEDNIDHLDISRLPQELGLWIDPIDSTSEYIQGRTGEEDVMTKTGLPCVTVLIGVFDRTSGAPLVGVVNQPFSRREGDKWISQYFYGVDLPEIKLVNPLHPLTTTAKLVAVSSSEDDGIRETLSRNGYTPIELAGAGFKLLKIVTGEVHAYVLSKPTTFLWDICACHAILNSLGGGIIDFTTLEPIQYKPGHGVKQCCNDGGIIAYRDEKIRNDLTQILNLVEKREA